MGWLRTDAGLAAQKIWTTTVSPWIVTTPPSCHGAGRISSMLIERLGGWLIFS